MKPRVVLIPGNGGGSTKKDNWFPSVKQELEHAGLTVIDEDFPDSVLARSCYWLPFLQNELKVDENTILVGHSSGAIAAMRLAEKQRILGSVLVGTYYTDLNIDAEKQSGYFDTPWDWERIKNNQSWTVIFASQNDPWIPVAEPRFIHEKLDCEYHEYKGDGHFGGEYYKPDFPELSHAILRNVNQG